MQIEHRITPEDITADYVLSGAGSLSFLFGSNKSGIHGGGAANFAHKELGAEWGVAFGPTGHCFALPTKDFNVVDTLPISEIKTYVDGFIEHARLTPGVRYLVTEIGCGLAGYEPKDIAPLFEGAVSLDNISLPQRFWEILGG